ncbi:MAG: AAA family ATPase [Treponema sp.]|nr:AAA family ATPase [Treponema sp.]
MEKETFCMQSSEKITQRMKALLSALNKNLYGKEEAVRLALLSAVASESIFFMGPPGTAKSMISRRIAQAFKIDADKDYFEYLMNEFSTPDEICGPVELSALNENPSRYVRQTEGYLPKAKVAFLDEIWKSGPAILNTLLTIINEKKFHNGSQVERVPLMALSAASNELPEKDRGLEALWDRFILRVYVNPVNNIEDFFKIVDGGGEEFSLDDGQKLDINEVIAWKPQIDAVVLDDKARSVIQAIRQELTVLNSDEARAEEEKYYVSDRRWKKIVHILKTSAFLNGRAFVDLMDCSLIEHMIWSTDAQHTEAGEIVGKILKQNGFSVKYDIADIEKSIRGFEKHIDNTFFTEDKSKPEKSKMRDGSFAYKLKNEVTIDGVNGKIKFVGDKSYYTVNGKESQSYSYGDMCTDVKFNTSTNKVEWKNGYDNTVYEEEVCMVGSGGLVPKKEIFKDASYASYLFDTAERAMYKPLAAEIEEAVDTLNEIENKQTGSLKSNIFAEKKYVGLVANSISETKKRLEDLNVELEKQHFRITELMRGNN